MNTRLCLLLLGTLWGHLSSIAQDVGVIVAGIDAEKSIAAWCKGNLRFVDVNSKGVRFGVLRESKLFGDIRIGVHSEGEIARRLLDEAIRETSVVPLQDLSGRLGDRAVSWEKRIAFCRGNVLVDVWMQDGTTYAVAKAVDDALQHGGDGIDRGNTVRRPVVKGYRQVGDRVEAELDERVEGYSSLVDATDSASDLQRAKRICFATRRCVVAQSIPYEVQGVSVGETTADQASVPQQESSAGLVARIGDLTRTPMERCQAIIKAAQNRDTAAIPHLIRLVAAEGPLVLKQEAIRALGKIGGQSAVDELMRILKAPLVGSLTDEGDNEAVLRRNCVLAIGEAGDRAALSLLRELAQSNKDYASVRELAEATIRTLEGRK